MLEDNLLFKNVTIHRSQVYINENSLLKYNFCI